jgi:hypothetical protein
LKEELLFMNIKTSWKQWLTAGIAIGAIALAAISLAPQTTFAQTDDSTGDDTTTETAPAPWGRGGMMDFDMKGFDLGGMRGEYQGYLAEALGITVEELQAAQLKAQDAMLAQAVEDGTLTQEQADLMQARRAFMQFYADQTEQSVEDALNAAVEAGAITQEQADLLLEQQGQMGRGMFGGMLRDRMFGGDSHHRGMMPGMDGQMPGRGNRMMPGNQAPAAPTETPEANS